MTREGGNKWRSADNNNNEIKIMITIIIIIIIMITIIIITIVRMRTIIIIRIIIMKMAKTTVNATMKIISVFLAVSNSTFRIKDRFSIRLL